MSQTACDFCGHEPTDEPVQLSPDGYLELRDDGKRCVLKLRMQVDPGVSLGDFKVKVSSYNVCTACIFSFLKMREGGNL